MMTVKEARLKAVQNRLKNKTNVQQKIDQIDLNTKSYEELKEILLELQERVGDEETPKMILIKKIQALQSKEKQFLNL